MLAVGLAGPVGICRARYQEKIVPIYGYGRVLEACMVYVVVMKQHGVHLPVD